MFLPIGRRGRVFLLAGGTTAFDGQVAPLYQSTLGGPFRLSAFERDEFRGVRTAHVGTGYLHQLARLPDFVGGPIYGGVWIETGWIEDRHCAPGGRARRHRPELLRRTAGRHAARRRIGQREHCRGQRAENQRHARSPVLVTREGGSSTVNAETKIVLVLIAVFSATGAVSLWLDQPPVITAISFSLLVTACLYRFFGGVEGSRLAVASFKASGSAAVFGATLWYVNDQLAARSPIVEPAPARAHHEELQGLRVRRPAFCAVRGLGRPQRPRTGPLGRVRVRAARAQRGRSAGVMPHFAMTGVRP